MSKPEKTQADQKRAALAEAIREHADADAERIAARAALDRATGLVEDAQSHSEAVKAALATARDGRASRLRQAAQGGDVIEVATSSREARFAEIDAADELAAARDVLTGCQANADDAEDGANRALKRVEAAALPVLTGEVNRVLAEAAELHAAYEAKMAAVDFLTLLLPFGSPERVKITLMRPTLPPGVSPPDRSQHPAVAAWREARQQLLKSADAPLPA
jgi:hypothetical protein